VARARQGQVYVATIGGRIGFARDPVAPGPIVLVVQGNVLNEILDTVQVVPLVPAAEAPRFSLNVAVAGDELGRADHVALVHLARALALSRLQPGPLAAVAQPTLERVLTMLSRVFS